MILFFGFRWPPFAPFVSFPFDAANAGLFEPNRGNFI